MPGRFLAVLALLAAAALCSPPAPAFPARGGSTPDLELKDLEGSSLRLSSLRGEVVLLHFWATWCPHCLVEMPLLADLARDASFQEVRILAVNLGEPRRVVTRYLKSHSLELPVYLDSRGKVAEACGVLGLPATVVLDSSGRRAAEIAMGSLDREALRKILEPLLEKKGVDGEGD